MYLFRKYLFKIKANLFTRKAAYILVSALSLLIFYQIILKPQTKVIEKSIPVSIFHVHTKDIPVYISALGTVTPESSVTVTAMVSGRIEKVLFKDGQKVKAGDLLAEIDSRQYRAQVAQYQGQLERDHALLENAKVDLKRYEDLWKENSVSKQTLDTQKALVDQYEGTVKIDQGLLDNAKVNLSYCYITSPIDGQVGLRQIDEGNILQTQSANEIAVINTINPITVVFSIPESDLQKVIHEFTKGNMLEVFAYNESDDKVISKGSLLAIDNQIDLKTGTVKLKAIFNNDANTLFPNQFVNIKLLIKTINNAVIVPVSAVQKGRDGDYVFKLEKASKVKLTEVEVGESFNNLLVIKSGLNLGDKIVYEGTDKLTDGTRVSYEKKQ